MTISKSLEGNYLTEISNGGLTFFADSQDDGRGVHPHAFIESALAACMNITTRMVLDRMSLAYDAVEVRVALDRPTKEDTVIRYSIDIKGDIPEKVKKQITDKVFNCPVRKTLTSRIQVTPFETENRDE
jgi:Predicted redox protein, regulator of disulfide bond formation